jgi:hypothetical protein
VTQLSFSGEFDFAELVFQQGEQSNKMAAHAKSDDKGEGSMSKSAKNVTKAVDKTIEKAIGNTSSRVSTSSQRLMTLNDVMAAILDVNKKVQK